MDVAPKKLYMREHSNVIRIWSSASRKLMVENPAFHLDRKSRVIVVAICRIRQRLLKHAWQLWTDRTAVKHDYTKDLRIILSRQLPTDELRTELEIEVLYKWVMQAKDIDPTGIASTIFHCKKKSAIYNALQQLRLEFYGPGEAVIFQGDFPRIEDGHFTIIRGDCEVVQFTDNLVRLTKLLACARKKRWEEAKELLAGAQVVAHIPTYSGFGELSTLTGVKRAATILSSKNQEITEILVLPKHPLLDLLKYRNKETTQSSVQSEAIDFLRQSGLANRISPKDLVLAASSMSKRTLSEGDILFYKGEEVNCIYMVVSGEFLLDTNDFVMEGIMPMPFVNSSADFCYSLSAGSILGDEGMVGDKRVFESTAAVVSSVAVVFQAEGFAMNFIAEKMGCLRYSALYYRDRLCWEAEHQVAEQINPYTFFDSLRKSIAYTKPFRGTTKRTGNEGEEAPVITAIKERKALKAQRLLDSRGGGGRSPTGRRSPNHGYRASMTSDFRPLSPAAFNMMELQKKLDTSLFPRVLRGVSLHRAVEINKSVKKFLQNCIRIHAKENILFEELKRKTILESLQEELLHKYTQNTTTMEIHEDHHKDDDTEKRQTKNAFERSLKDYFERRSEITRQLAEAEESNRSENAITTGAAVRFFSLLGENDSESIQSESTMSLSIDGLAENSFVIDENGKLTEPSSSLSKHSSSKHSSSHHNIHITPTSSQEGTPSVQSLPILSKEEGVNNNQEKIKEYFEWLDGLKRQQFRALMNQSKQTIDINSDYDIEAKLGLNHLSTAEEGDVDWKEVGEIFSTYSLTPADLHLPWIFARSSNSQPVSSQIHGILKTGGSNSPKNRPSSPTAQQNLEGKKTSRPSSPVKTEKEETKRKGITFNEVTAVKEIPRNPSADGKPPIGRSRRSQIVDKAVVDTTLPAASSLTPRKSSVSGKGRRGGIAPLVIDAKDENQLREEYKTKAKLENALGGGYVASDWREEYVQKKARDLLLAAEEFHRYKIPENRRTIPLHIKVHGFDQKIELKEKQATQLPSDSGNNITAPPVVTETNKTTAQAATADTKGTSRKNMKIITENNETTKTVVLTPHAHDMKDQKTLEESQQQLMDYIDSPQIFLEYLLHTDVNSRNRNLDLGHEWNTRYLASQPNQKKKPPSVLQSVRTHLKENLDHYSKEHLLKFAEQLKIENYEQATRGILGGRKVTSNETHGQSPKSQAARASPKNVITSNTNTNLQRENSDVSSVSPTPSLSRSVSFKEKSEVSEKIKPPPFILPEHRTSSFKDETIHEEAGKAIRLNTIAEASTTSTSAPPTIMKETIPRPPDLVLTGDTSALPEFGSQSSNESIPENAEKSNTTPTKKPPRPAKKSPASTARLSRNNSMNNNANAPNPPKGKSPLSRNSSKNNIPVTPTQNQSSSASPGQAISNESSTDTINAANPAAAAGGTATNVSFHAPKISDLKLPSKALQAFEEFMLQQQTIPSKAASEGRKKANRSSRFRLPTMIAQEERTMNNVQELVNIHEIQRDRLKMELTIFQALHPNYTLKDKELFIKSFHQLNPKLSTNIAEVDDILETIHKEIQDNSSAVGRQLFPDQKNGVLPSPGMTRQISMDTYGSSPYSHSSSYGAGGFSNATSPTGGGGKSGKFFAAPPNEWDEQMQLERWQEYTLQNILQNKNGERKTLPVVKLPKSMTEGSNGKRFRSSNSTKAVLVTISAKKDEELIEGPTGYLELYQSSFKVRTSSKAKERIVQELKHKLPNI